MKLAHYTRMALRESRRSRGRITLFMACIAVGVAAIVVVAGLSKSVTDGIREQGRKLMAADVTVEGRRPLPAELDTLLANFPLPPGGRIERADVREFVSVVLAPATNASQLAELKVVQGDYPFYGTLKLNPDRSLSQLLTVDDIVVATELLTRLNLKIGDSLRIGGTDFRIAGEVLEEPDKLAITFTLGPRVFMAPAALDRTALLDRGARVEYRAMLKLPTATTGRDAARLKRTIQRDLADAEFYRVRTYTEAQPALRRSFERIGKYLGLVGLLSLLVGGVGVAQVARAWLASRMDDVAILRCIGATPREVVVLFLIQTLAMALLASLVGAALGTAMLSFVPTILAGLMPPELITPWQPLAIARGVLLGLTVAMLFTVPLLVGLRRVPPVRVLRRDAEPVKAGRLANAVGAVLVLVAIWAAAVWQSESWWYGSLFVVGIVVSIAVLWAAALAVSRLARLLPRDAGGVRLRHGLTHLARPGAATVGAIVALGLGVTFVFATRTVERHLGEQLSAEVPGDAPSTFLLDVQPDQWPALEALLKDHGATGINSQPIVTARFSAIDGKSVNELTDPRPVAPGEEPRRRSRWALTREQRITYGDTLPRGNRVIAGQFPSGRPAGVSIHEEFARDLGVSVGSVVTLDVQGVPVDLTVTSLRTIDWRTFGINFFLFAEPGPLDDAPQQRVAVAKIPAGELVRTQTAIVQAFPNVTVIHIRDVMDKVLAVLENLQIAVRALGGFTLVAGVVVLGGTVAATQARRSKEVALLKTIGMTRRDVAAVFTIEYALTGAVAAAIGITAGSVLAWAVIAKVMDLPWTLNFPEIALAAMATVVLAVFAGLIASTRALRARPVEVLRTE